MSNKQDDAKKKATDKCALVPKRRFPEFRDVEHWEVKTIDSQLDYQQPTAYLVSSTNYSDAYNTPVLTAGKTFILGYTNEQDGVFCKNLPVIIFDDFTTGMQFVDFAFKAKSSAMKILQPKNGANIKFMYEAMQMISYEVAAHERHWISKFAPMLILVPPPAEQQKIADCLASIDEQIALEAKKLATLKTHKKGLMQQLFPAEGETMPQLRFPEFRDAGEWEEKELGQLGELVSGLTYSPEDVRNVGLLVLRSSNVKNGVITLDDNVYVRDDIKGANLSRPNDILICVRNGSKSLIGKNALIPAGMPTCTHGAFMTIFRTVSTKFIFQLFQTEAYEKQVAADMGATINSINGNQLKKYKFFIPKSLEQKRIADCLGSLDDAIAVQSQKLNTLKLHKKGLMQQIFPMPHEVYT